MAYTPPGSSNNSNLVSELQNAKKDAQDILNNPFSSDQAKKDATSALKNINDNLNSLSNPSGWSSNSDPNWDSGSSDPDWDSSKPLSSDNPVFNEPKPGFTEMAKENSEIIKKYENDFVGDTDNKLDPNYSHSNDFADEFEPASASPSGGTKPGEWDSLDYGTDWNDHHGKFKFLFKIKMGGPWQYYVKSVTRPKVRFVHQDINYYNFRSKVLTQTTFESITVVLWDEIKNSVVDFYNKYLTTLSGQGSGKWGIDSGFEKNGSTSSKSYSNNGYGETVLSTIIIEQLFAYGTKSNRFIFKNARIEAMDLDDLSMESSDLSTLTITFNYDSVECVTVESSVIHTDPSAKKDLLRGGGSAGFATGANDDGRQFNKISIGGAAGAAIPGFGNLLNSAESIFASAVPSIVGSVSIGSDGINANFGGIIPGIGGSVNFGPDGVSGSVSGGLPGIGGSVNFGPNGVSGSVSGGLPGIGGNVNFGPNGVSGSVGANIGPINFGGAFSPNNFSVGVNTVIPIIPPIGSVVPENVYLDKMSVGETYDNNLMVEPYKNG